MAAFDQLTWADAFPATAVVVPGAAGTAVRVSVEMEFDAGPVPFKLCAVTLKLYPTPYDRPVMVQVDPPVLEQVAPPGVAVAVYLVIAAPPVDAACHVRATDVPVPEAW